MTWCINLEPKRLNNTAQRVVYTRNWSSYTKLENIYFQFSTSYRKGVIDYYLEINQKRMHYQNTEWVKVSYLLSDLIYECAISHINFNTLSNEYVQEFLVTYLIFYWSGKFERNRRKRKIEFLKCINGIYKKFVLHCGDESLSYIVQAF